MSYDIVYEQLALRVPKEDVAQQACTFFRERLNHTDTQSTNELKQALYERYRLRLRENDLFMLHMLIGSSNLFDTETNKRARSWQFCGVNTFSQLLVKYGCDWSAAAESGEVKLNGRDTKAEGWIRALRNTLNHAKDYGVMPYCHTLEVWLKAPLDTSKQTQLDELKTRHAPSHQTPRILPTVHSFTGYSNQYLHLLQSTIKARYVMLMTCRMVAVL